MLRTLVFKVFLFIWFAAWTPFLLLGLISTKLERAFILADAWGVLFLVRTIAGIKYQIHYPLIDDENGIPFKHNINQRLDGRAIIASKHMSMLEVAILVTHVPNAFFIIKRELLWIPIYGWAFWKIGLIGVNRARGATNMNKLAEKVTENIMKGMTLIIFPEGTRVAPNKDAPLRRGLLFLAEHLKLPITPVGIDTGLYWPKRGKMRPGTTHIYFEHELPSSASLAEIKEAINRHSC
ncbi:MAG: 1-acyl-sn-glycerol-3-phosphate acyltransferase [Alphaproteobacteria bacterium]|nr:1-acyl-sn-glycerol-3-phosphate acyltransferase [Alphaproteobacteria bacterium]